MSRRSYREKVFQLLFRAAFVSAEEMEQQFLHFAKDEYARKSADLTQEDEETENEEERKLKERIDEVTDTVRRIIEKIPEIDRELDEKMDDWTTERVGRVELTLLRLAVYEIRYDEDISPAIAINEAVELAKRFGQDKSPEFINGVLAKFA